MGGCSAKVGLALSGAIAMEVDGSMVTSRVFLLSIFDTFILTGKNITST